MLGIQGTPAQTGKEGLFRLVKQARVSYQEEVVTRQKSYRRYVLDFIHSKRFHDATDAWSKNEHQKNYHTIVDLLRNHEKLVRRYFEQEPFAENSISMLLGDFYTADLQEDMAPVEPDRTCSENSEWKDSNFPFEPLLDRHTIDLIVQLANEVCLFKEILDADNVANHYATDTLQTVTSRNNTKLVLLLDKLASHDVISYNWQSVIAKKRLIISSSGKKCLNQHDMSSTLNRIKDTPPTIAEKQLLDIIDRYIALIKSREV